MTPQQVYERMGTRYLHRFPLINYSGTVPLALSLAVLSAPYVDASAAEIAGLFLAELLAFAGLAVLADLRWRPVGRRIEEWIEGGRDPAVAAELWHDTVQLTYRMPLLAFRDGAILVGLADTGYHAAVLGLTVPEAAVGLVSLFAAGVYLALLFHFGLELYLRPAIRDLAEHTPVARRPDGPRRPFALKVFAALLLVGGSGGLSLGWLLSLSDPTLERLAVNLALALASTLTCTLMFTFFFTVSLSAPLGDILRATERVREGDLSARVPPVSDDDLGLVGASFNEMTAELARSREELVSAREEERRRLRRDLHDELGPTLASVAMRIEAAAELVDRDPEAAKAMLAALRDEVGDSVADIRRVVYALRPPQLDELGLLGAIRECAARVAESNGGVDVRLEVPDRLRPLPAAVEVATFRIVQEALVNTARHAQASSCSVRVEANGVLEFEVSDDGVGLRDGRRSGVGLASMRERASELGGTCTFESAPSGGTVVRARLPLPPA